MVSVFDISQVIFFKSHLFSSVSYMGRDDVLFLFQEKIPMIFSGIVKNRSGSNLLLRG